MGSEELAVGKFVLALGDIEHATILLLGTPGILFQNPIGEYRLRSA